MERLRSILGSSRKDSGPMEMEEVRSKSIDMRERAISAAGAAFISAVIVNPLDVAKTRLQAQAAGVNYQQQVACAMELPTFSKVAVDGRCLAACTRNINVGVAPVCPPLGASQYKGTWDVVYKIARQEGFFRLWTGLNPALAMAIPTVGIYLPCYDFLLESIEAYFDNHMLNLKPYAPIAAGSIARSLACIIVSPVELARTRMQAQKEMRGGTPPGLISVLHNAFSTTEGLQGGS
jgi:solute carrier family 25 protein 39/40